MQPSFKSSLLRSVATVGLVSALAVAAPQAKAAQINSVQNVQISTVADANAPGGQVCRIGQVFNFTFTNNDGFFAGQPRDFVHVAITDINGDPSPAAPMVYGTGWGAPGLVNFPTGNFTQGFLNFVPQPKALSSDTYFTIFEASGPNAADRGAILRQTLVPSLILRGAGAPCHFLRPNNEPTADAGANQTVGQGATVTLDGSGSSDIDGDPIVSYTWNQGSGPTVTLSNPNGQTTTFVAPPVTAPTQLIFQLIVNDGTSNNLVNSNVAITVLPNQPPVVDAGADATIAPGGLVTLSATATDPETDPMTFSWTQVSGPAVTLTGAATLTPSFTAPVKTNIDQDIVLQFEADDGTTSSTDTITLTVPANVGPNADAGADQSVSGGASVGLDGRNSSDGDGDPITYAWTQTGGPAVTLSGAASAQPAFTAPAKTNAAQTLTFDLTVDDGLTTDVDTVEVTVAANVGPIASAGADQTVAPGASVQLSALGSSDGDGDAITYGWTQVGGPTVTLGAASTAEPTFTAPAKAASAQLLEFEVTVDDGFTTATDRVIVTVPANVGPIANAGVDRTIPSGTPTVSLFSAGSADGDGDPITFAWAQTAGPPVTLSDAAGAAPTFPAPPVTAVAQLLTFNLTVDDGFATDTDSVTLTFPANTVPTADAGAAQTAGQGATVTLDGSGSSDPDIQTLSYAWTQVSGPAVTLTGATTVSPTFVAPTVTTQTDLVFELVVNDGLATSAPQQVTISVTPNQPPVANAGADITGVAGGATVTLSGSATDAESDPLTYQWTQTAGPSVALSGATTLSPTFTAPPKTNAAQTLTFELVANDGFANSTADAVNVVIAANIGPTANAGADLTATGGTAVSLTGAASSDGDGDGLTYSWTQVGGPAVTLAAANTASPSFTAPTPTASAQTLEFELTVDDGLTTSTDRVVVTVPANAPPIADAGVDQTGVPGGATVQLAGSASDPNNDPLTYQWTQAGGPGVALQNPQTLQPTFTAPPKTNAVQTLTFDLVANDGVASSAPDSVIVTIAANVGPTADAGADLTVAGGSPVSLSGAASTDGDGDTITYAWAQVAGPSVTLSGATTASPGFIAPAPIASARTLEFELTVNDGLSTASDRVLITVAANAPPIADAGPDLTGIVGGATVSLSGSASDPESDPLTYLWTQASGPAVALTGATTLSPSFVAPPKTSAAQVLTFSLVASDPFNASAPDTVTVTIGANVAPVANAGPDATVAGLAGVTLDASASSDPDSDPLTYQWTQVSGPPVTLSGAGTVTPSFVAPTKSDAVQILVFEVAVSDGVDTSLDRVEISIAPNGPPTADAGPDQLAVTPGSTVTLTGSGADPENDPLSFAWTQSAGPSVSLSDPNAAATTFTAPAKTNAIQTLQFDLTASDGIATSAPDSVLVTLAANIGPIADAGADAVVASGASVILDASASRDGDGDSLSYRWTQVSGAAVTLSGATTAQAGFTAPAKTASDQVLVFAVEVDDGLTTATDRVSITVPANAVPVANAGPDASIAGGAQVTLDGSGSSDPDGDPLNFLWTQVGGPSVVLSGADAAQATFTAPPKAAAVQSLDFSLVVDDGVSRSSPDLVTVTVAANVPPTAIVGPAQTVRGGTAVTLDASGSVDGDGDTLSYAWRQVSGPTVALSDVTSATPTFIAPAAAPTVQSLVFEVTVSDGVQTATAKAEVSVEANRLPVAVAGADIGPIDSGSTVRLDGSASSDPDGDALSYVWTQVAGPSVSLTGADTAAPSFVAPLVSGFEDLVFQLVVNDGQADSQPDDVRVTIRAIGTITIVQEVVGADRSFAFTSNVPGLPGTLTTSGGRGQISAASVPAGGYTLNAADYTADGYALTSVRCNDGDSRTDLQARSIQLVVSPNEALVCTFSSADTRTAATEAIGEFLTARNAALLTAQPSVERRIDRLNGGVGGSGGVSAAGFAVPGTSTLPFALRLNEGQAYFATSLALANAVSGKPVEGGQPFDIWAEAFRSKLTYADHEGDLSVFYLGADYLLSDRLLIGGLVQVDTFDHTGSNRVGAVDGDGWLAGPYLTARLSDTLFADVRAAWGESENTISPLGTWLDSFNTERALYSASLIGQYSVGERTTFQPELSLRYLQEEQHAYRDRYNVLIPGQSVDQGELAFRPMFRTSVTLDDRWEMRPFASLQGLYTFGDASNSVLGDGLRFRAEAGADFIGWGMLRFGASAFYDGAGAEDFDNLGIRLSISLGR